MSRFAGNSMNKYFIEARTRLKGYIIHYILDMRYYAHYIYMQTDVAISARDIPLYNRYDNNIIYTPQTPS